MPRSLDTTTTRLTVKQETFCQEMVRSGNATASYKYAYDVEGVGDGSVGAQASILLSRSKIAQRVERLLQDKVAALGISRDYVLASLKRELDADDGDRAKPARVKSAELLMRYLGLLTEGEKTPVVSVVFSYSIGGAPINGAEEELPPTPLPPTPAIVPPATAEGDE